MTITGTLASVKCHSLVSFHVIVDPLCICLMCFSSETNCPCDHFCHTVQSSAVKSSMWTACRVWGKLFRWITCTFRPASSGESSQQCTHSKAFALVGKLRTMNCFSFHFTYQSTCLAEKQVLGKWQQKTVFTRQMLCKHGCWKVRYSSFFFFSPVTPVKWEKEMERSSNSNLLEMLMVTGLWIFESSRSVSYTCCVSITPKNWSWKHLNLKNNNSEIWEKKRVFTSCQRQKLFPSRFDLTYYFVYFTSFYGISQKKKKISKRTNIDNRNDGEVENGSSLLPHPMT